MAPEGARVRVIAANIGVAAAYLVAGKLGLLLAIPPGYATAVWPASGIALAAVLLFGGRVLPGILLGSFLVNIGVSFDGGSAAAAARSVAMALGIGAGAALQAGASAWLVRRFVGYPTALDGERQVGLFLLLGGPAGCLVNATWSVTILAATGVVSPQAYTFNWGTWWIGDTIGALIFSPLILAWVGEPREHWRPRRLALTLPLGLMFAIVVAFFVRASAWEQERVQRDFEERADAIGDALRTSLERYVDVLRSISDYYAASSEVRADEFGTFVAGPLQRFPGVQGVSWNPRIRGEDRELHEALLRREAGNQTRITERDARSRLIPAAARAEYVYVRHIEPLAANRAALGYDVLSDAARREALDFARDGGTPAATAPIELVQDERREPAFLVFHPVYRRDRELASVQARREALLGYATGVFRVAAVVAGPARGVDPGQVRIRLEDRTRKDSARFLFTNLRSGDAAAGGAGALGAGPAHEIGLDVAGRRWVLSVSPTRRHLEANRGWQAWSVLAGGLGFTALLGAFLLVVTGRAGRVERLAQRLRDEVEERSRAEERVTRLNRVHAVLSGISATIARARGREELFREACRIAVEAGQFPMVWLGVVDSGTSRIVPVAANEPAEGLLRIAGDRLIVGAEAPFAGPVALAVREKRPFVSNDVETDERITLKREHAERGIRSVAMLPLLISGKVAGILALHAAERGFFSEDEMKLLLELAGDIAFALDHWNKSERLERLAYYDVLTGLANRTLFHERLTQLLAGAGRMRRRLALVLLDIARFREVNDAFGRKAGDELLQQVAQRLSRHPTGAVSISRLGTDQFAIALPEAISVEEVGRRVEAIHAQVSGTPYAAGNQELHVAARMGIAFFPDDAVDADVLLGRAEAALKKAKERGERYLFFEQQMSERVAERLALETRVRLALERQQFELHYQPKVDLGSGSIAGVEALIRWQDPQGTMVPLEQLLPVLEETGLILPVGAWALRRATSDHRRWLERGLKPPRVAVNVAAVQLRQRDFVSVVEQAIMEGVAPTGLDLEISEGLVMQDVEDNIRKLTELRSLGVNIAIDRFGTAYSSLAHLAKLPVQALKIDRSFVGTMLKDPDTMSLVSTIISLAHSLRLKVVAEGVDDERQAHLLRLLRCDAMQGFYVSRPVPFDEMSVLLAKGRLA